MVFSLFLVFSVLVFLVFSVLVFLVFLVWFFLVFLVLVFVVVSRERVVVYFGSLSTATPISVRVAFVPRHEVRQCMLAPHFY